MYSIICAHLPSQRPETCVLSKMAKKTARSLSKLIRNASEKQDLTLSSQSINWLKNIHASDSFKKQNWDWHLQILQSFSLLPYWPECILDYLLHRVFLFLFVLLVCFYINLHTSVIIAWSTPNIVCGDGSLSLFISRIRINWVLPFQYHLLFSNSFASLNIILLCVKILAI